MAAAILRGDKALNPPKKWRSLASIRGIHTSLKTAMAATPLNEAIMGFERPADGVQIPKGLARSLLRVCEQAMWTEYAQMPVDVDRASDILDDMGYGKTMEPG